MANTKIWCVMKPGFGKSDNHYIDADSIGTKRFARKFFKGEVAQGRVIEITKGQALDILIEDILDHDSEGLRLGNWVYTMAARKLKERLNLI